MIKLQPALISRFTDLLVQSKVDQKYHGSFLKWLRYYLDFCHKYHYDRHALQSLLHFLDKLEEKKQTAVQQQQAHNAISVYYELVGYRPDSVQKGKDRVSSRDENKLCKSRSETIGPADVSLPLLKKRVVDRADVSIDRGNKWRIALNELANQIKVRHYSLKTLKSYATWVRKLQRFSRSKDPQLLATHDVKTFLTDLAVTQKVSASSQNQAFNALLFFSDMSSSENSEK